MQWEGAGHAFSMLRRRWAVPRRAGAQLSLGTGPGHPTVGYGPTSGSPQPPLSPNETPKLDSEGLRSLSLNLFTHETGVKAGVRQAMAN